MLQRLLHLLGLDLLKKWGIKGCLHLKVELAKETEVAIVEDEIKLFLNPNDSLQLLLKKQKIW